MSQSCIFCKIIAGQLNAKKRLETEQVLAFDDINPDAKIHILIVPKVHIVRTDEIKSTELALAMVSAVAQLKQLSGAKAYKIVVNNGPEAGQVVPHLHWHFLSNWID